MHENDVIYKTIRDRIIHSYETFMDNGLGQLNIHLWALKKYYKKEDFDLENLEESIAKFLTNLQGEVDKLVGIVNINSMMR